MISVAVIIAIVCVLVVVIVITVLGVTGVFNKNNNDEPKPPTPPTPPTPAIILTTFNVTVETEDYKSELIPLKNANVSAVGDDGVPIFQTTDTSGKCSFIVPVGCWEFTCDSVKSTLNDWKEASSGEICSSMTEDTDVSLQLVRENANPLISQWEITDGDMKVSVTVAGKGSISWGEQEYTTPFDTVSQIVLNHVYYPCIKTD